MPTYEYQCKSCNHRFETWQKMMDEPLTVCPECQGSIRRVLFPAGIVFKGSGFYKTDHGNGGVVNSESKPEGKNGTDAAVKTEGSSTVEKATETKSKPGEKSGEKASTPAAKNESSAAAAAD